MILANVRARLRDADLKLAVIALGRTSSPARAERLLLEEGPDRLLDDPDLLPALLAVRSLAVPSAALFAYVAVRHVLLRAGVTERELADYLAALILEFGDHARAQRVTRTADDSYGYLVDIVADLAQQGGQGERDFLLQAHLGNYSLWFAGLFPDRVAARRDRSGGPDLPYYDELGRHGYDLASRHRLADHFGMAGIFRSAAERFPALRTAFNRLSDRVLFPHVVTRERVLRSL